jgi:uncharacterized protein YlzI (FlbEa/FlbD family)
MASITITNGEELTVKETLKEVYGKISNQEKMGGKSSNSKCQDYLYEWGFT